MIMIIMIMMIIIIIISLFVSLRTIGEHVTNNKMHKVKSLFTKLNKRTAETSSLSKRS